jgi:hypothetical protein
LIDNLVDFIFILETSDTGNKTLPKDWNISHGISTKRT